MKKRILALLLTLCMTLALMSGVAVAAEVTEVGSDTELTAAIADGGEIKLTSDITLTAGVVVSEGTTVALDFNGCTITGNGITCITNNGDLTLTDSIGTGGITVNSTTAVNCIKNTGDLTIQGGNYSLILGKSVTSYAIRNEGTSLNITGGTFRSEMTVTAGNPTYVFGLKGSGSVSISGSVVAEAVTQATKTIAPACVMYIMTAATSNVTISGGSFTATHNSGAGYLVRCKDTTDTKPTITLTGGELCANELVRDTFYGTLSITGGTYTQPDGKTLDVSGYVAVDYIQDRLGSVIPAIDTEEELLAALAAETDITLAADIETEAELTLLEGATLDLNGCTLTAASLNASEGEVIDSKQSGLLKGNAIFADNNSQLPLYDAASEGYRMAEVTFQSIGDAVSYTFRFDMEAEYMALLADNGIEVGVYLEIGEETVLVGPVEIEGLFTTLAENSNAGIRATFTGVEGLGQVFASAALYGDGSFISGERTEYNF